VNLDMTTPEERAQMLVVARAEHEAAVAQVTTLEEEVVRLEAAVKAARQRLHDLIGDGRGPRSYSGVGRAKAKAEATANLVEDLAGDHLVVRWRSRDSIAYGLYRVEMNGSLMARLRPVGGGGSQRIGAGDHGVHPDDVAKIVCLRGGGS
jgi:hypothetical protein